MNSNDLKNLSDRLNYALELTHTRKADLARAIDVAPQAIQFLCSSKTQTSRFTFEIATALGLNTRWLATGEGEMFIADDPKKQLFKNYSKIPFLQTHQLKSFFISNNKINDNEITEWFPLITNNKDTVAIQMLDASMEPIVPLGAILFISEINKITHNENNYVFSYFKKFDTFAVRRLVKNGTSTYLSPINSEFFKEILLNNDVIVLGVITDCFWHVRS